VAPIESFSNRPHGGQELREIAVMLVQSAQLLDEHHGGRQHRHRDGEHLALLGALQQSRLDGHAVDAVQHVHDRVAAASLEQPVLRRIFDGEAGVPQGGGGGRRIGLGDDQIDVMAWFGCAIGPQRVTAG
jgi:hypothetical protein